MISTRGTHRVGALLALLLVVCLGCWGLSGCAPAAPQDDKKIAIIHTNDIHGYDQVAEATDHHPGVMGIAAVAQLKKDYQEQGYEVLLFDDGDSTQGNNLVNLSEGKAAIDFMNAAGYDAMALGNHEFDWGADVTEARKAQADFPFLSANIIVDATGDTFVEPRTTFTLENGTKVGVFALDTPETKTKSSPKNTAGLTFLEGDDLYACAQEQVNLLRQEGCDVVICLGHLGSVGGIAPNRSYDVLENTTGIDVFIDGHDHKVVNETKGETLLVSTGCHLENIGVVKFENGVWSEELVTFGSYDKLDQATNELVEKTASEVEAKLSETIASSTVDLNGERDPGVRTQETNLGDFAADASKWQAQAVSETPIDAAIVNGGSIRASIPAGDISMGLLKTVFPYNNSLNVVTLTGTELLETIEAATATSPAALGSFPQVSGIKYTIDTSVAYEQGDQYPDSTFYAPAKPGSRVTIESVGDRAFNLTDTYKIAVSSFLTDGGDSYYVIAKAYNENGYITGINDSDMLTNYLNSELGGVIGDRYATAQGNITIK